MRWIYSLLFCLFALGALKINAQPGGEKGPATVSIELSLPAYLYEGDRMEVVVKITNISNAEQTGQVQLQLWDAVSKTSVDGWMQNIFPVQYFTVAAGATETAAFPIEVPYLFKKPIRWQAIAQAGNVVIAKEGYLPILTTKVLATESLLLNMQGNNTKTFTFQNLVKADAATEHAAVVTEVITNPIWHVIEALPSLVADTIETADQAWNAIFAYAVAAKISHDYPTIQETITKWKQEDTTALSLDLKRNQNLKALFRTHTPWVLGATNPLLEKNRITTLFDAVSNKNNLINSLNTLKQFQKENGSFAWFANGPEDRFITQWIVAGMGYLKKGNALPEAMAGEINQMLLPALAYLDGKLGADYAAIAKIDISKKQVHSFQLYSCFVRSFFLDVPFPQHARTAYQYYQKQIAQFWKTEAPYLQAMSALTLYKTNYKKEALAILQSLKKTIANNKESPKNLYIQQPPVEETAVLLQAFTELTKDSLRIATLQNTLLASKKLSQWHSAPGTLAACSALMLQSSSRLSTLPHLQIKLGNTSLSAGGEGSVVEGYFKRTIVPPAIQPEMGNINVNIQTTDLSNTGKQQLQPAVYWHYFKDANTTKASPVTLKKQLYKKQTTGSGSMILPLTEESIIRLGDTLHIRITATTQRNLEHLQLEDHMAAAFTILPAITSVTKKKVLYHRTLTTTGASFYIPLMQSGTTHFEYSVIASYAGTFNQGMATIQNLFGPPNIAHSQDDRIQVE